VDTKGRDVDLIEGWINGEEVYPMGPPRMPFSFICSRRVLPSVKVEKARRRPEKVNEPIPDRQGTNIPSLVGARMGRRQRDHQNALSPRLHLNGSVSALVDANQIRNRLGVPGVRRAR
jgi:hypothetical protein